MEEGIERNNLAIFQSTPPVRGATKGRRKNKKRKIEFQSTPPVRGATSVKKGRNMTRRISIHAPRAGGDCNGKPCASGLDDFNPRPPCGGRQSTICLNVQAWRISIHAPRAGGDLKARNLTLEQAAISIHAPRAGGDISIRTLRSILTNFNPRPPCGGRLEDIKMASYRIEFQSTPPVRGATWAAKK